MKMRHRRHRFNTGMQVLTVRLPRAVVEVFNEIRKEHGSSQASRALKQFLMEVRKP